MMKINTKKKSLQIKNNNINIKENNILKEGWADVAASQATDGSWTKIAKVALEGAWATMKGVWNTGIMLPVKLAWALSKGKSLRDVMTEWEDRDKEIKRMQRQIIQSTGVEDTVNAFALVCNPSALALDKWNEHNFDEKTKKEFKKWSIRSWNATAGRANAALVIDEDEYENSEDVLAKIAYANFVAVVCKKVLKKPIKQKEIDSREELKKLNITLASYISESNAISEKNSDYKLFCKYIYVRFMNSTKITTSKGNIKKWFEDNTNETKRKYLVDFFKLISTSGRSVNKASKDMLSNNLVYIIKEITELIRKIKNIENDFNDFKSSNSNSSEESSNKETKKESLNFSAKKVLTISNNKLDIILEKNEDKKEKKAKSKQEKEYLAMYKKSGMYYLDHINFLMYTRQVIVFKLFLLQSSAVYLMYKNYGENVKNKNYTVSIDSNVQSVITEFDGLIATLKLIKGYFKTLDKVEKLVGKSTPLFKLEDELIKEGINEKQILDQLNNSINPDDKTLGDNLLDAFAKQMNMSGKDYKEKYDLKDSDLNNVYKILMVSAFFKGLSDPDNSEVTGGIEEQKAAITNITSTYSSISPLINEILEKDKFVDSFKTLESNVNSSKCIQIVKDFKQSEQATNSIDEFMKLFDTQSVDAILKEKEKELEVILQINQNNNTENESSIEDLKYFTATNPYTDVAIINNEKTPTQIEKS